jgi:virulence-associated protein VapD
MMLDTESGIKTGVQTEKEYKMGEEITIPIDLFRQLKRLAFQNIIGSKYLENQLDEIEKQYEDEQNRIAERDLK